MKSLDIQIRQKEYRLDECQRRVVQLEGIIAELKCRAGELEHDIDLELSRTKISDPHHFAYSPLAKSLTHSRTNLERSIKAFEVQLADEKSLANGAIETLNELFQERQRRKEHVCQSAERSTRRSLSRGSMVPATVGHPN